MFINDHGYIETDLFTKPNVKNQLLLPYSAHPAFITRNIVFSLAIRNVRNVSDPEKREVRFKELEDRLRSRHYSPGIIKAGIVRAKSISREETLVKVVKENAENAPKLIVEYDPRTTPSYQNILNKFFKSLTYLCISFYSVFPIDIQNGVCQS